MTPDRVLDVLTTISTGTHARTIEAKDEALRRARDALMPHAPPVTQVARTTCIHDSAPCVPECTIGSRSLHGRCGRGL